MYFDIAFLSISFTILGIVYFLLFHKNGLKPKGPTPARVPRPNQIEQEDEYQEEEKEEVDTEGKTKKQLAKESKRQEKREKREVTEPLTKGSPANDLK